MPFNLRVCGTRFTLTHGIRAGYIHVGATSRRRTGTYVVRVEDTLRPRTPPPLRILPSFYSARTRIPAVCLGTLTRCSVFLLLKHRRLSAPLVRSLAGGCRILRTPCSYLPLSLNGTFYRLRCFEIPTISHCSEPFCCGQYRTCANRPWYGMPSQHICNACVVVAVRRWLWLCVHEAFWWCSDLPRLTMCLHATLLKVCLAG